MSNTRELLGKRIRSLRRLADLSQEGLAEKAGMSSKYLGEVEHMVTDKELRWRNEITRSR